MKLKYSADLKGHVAAVRLVLDQCSGNAGAVQCVPGGKGVSLEYEGCTITGVNTICKAIASECNPELLGDGGDVAAQVDQWLNFIHKRFLPASDDALMELNQWMSTRTFLCGHIFTLADLCMYAALSLEMVALPVAQQSVFCHVLRWYDHVHHAYDTATSASKSPVCPAVALPISTAPKPPASPVATATTPSAKVATGGTAAAAAASASAAAKPAAPAKAAGKGKEEKKGGGKVGAPVATAGKEGAPVATAEGAAAPPKEAAKGGKKGGGDADASEAEKKKAERAAKNAAKNAPAAAAPATPDALNILVGTIVTVKKHPDAEKLYVEEIDVGEAAPRQVVSGLVDWVAEADMHGRRVAVLCNLKPAKMRGVMSHGMVLCASAESAVEPLAVPEGVPNGERVMVGGFDAAPEPQLPPKKKIWEALMPDLATSAEGVAGYKGAPLATMKGPLTSKVTGAPVK